MPTEKPVPSITLSITQDDVKRVLDASKAMTETLEKIQNTKPIGSEGDAETQNKISNRPLREMIFEAAQQCQHSMLSSFLEKMKNSGSTSKEIHAGVLVFCDMDMKSKMQLLFEILGNETILSEGEIENSEKVLNRDGALSLFRSVIVAISSCIHQDQRVQIEIEKGAEPVRKRMKLEDGSPKSDSTRATQETTVDSVPELKSPSPSFDSSLATKEEYEFSTTTVRKEFEEIATYATDCLVKFVQKGTAQKSDSISISFETFGQWNKAEGGRIAPWLELLNLSKWRTPARPTERSLDQNQPKKEIISQDLKEVEKKTENESQKPQAALSKFTPAKEQPKKAVEPSPKIRAPSPALFEKDTSSRTLVSFDFTGAGPSTGPSSDFCINISEENLYTLRNLVGVTGLSGRSPHEIANILLGAARNCSHDGTEMKVLPIERFHTCLHQLLGAGSAKRLSKLDKDIFSSSFVDFFGCFNTGKPPLQSVDADAKEMAVGFSFLCAGNKSSKLACGFELLESGKSEGLTTNELTQFLRSYLTMLVGISLLTSSSEGVMKPKLNSVRRKAMHTAVQNGATWTIGHYLKHFEKINGKAEGKSHTFESFADWYTAGGYNVAPWLELLDLKKLLSLIGDNHDLSMPSPQILQDALPPFPVAKTTTPEFMSPSRPRPSSSDPYGHHKQPPPPAEVLFTFPLANQRSLVVLREDASYVRGVVDQLGLLSLSADEIWTSLYNTAVKQNAAKNPNIVSKGKSMPVSKMTFVQCMEEIIQSKSTRKKRSASGVSTSVSRARETLVNFFHSFDLHQVDSVGLNELMGGLTLLCGGKKSTKLAFAFGVFDQRPKAAKKRGKKGSTSNDSLGGEDLFLFLRSFLIVMFSCCRQSLDLSDDAVNRYIADTANMVTDDVMRYQWRTHKKDRVDFDEFGHWYNEGGFETAPWLELLDLRKWVTVDNLDSLDTLQSGTDTSDILASPQIPKDLGCPPAPPDDAVDASFFDDDEGNGIMNMDSIDEMDMILMQPSQDKENDSVLKLTNSFSYSPKPEQKQPAHNPNSLKFHLVVDDDHGGYVVSVSQKRIIHLRHILMESGLHMIDGEVACKKILAKAFVDDKSGRRMSYLITKEDFDSAMRGVITSRGMSLETQRTLSDILGQIFAAFDHDSTGRVNAVEIACGFTVLCKGKKSDKLEYAFEVLDKDRRGKLSRSDTTRYLRSFLTVLLNLVSTKSLDSDFEEDVMTTTGGMRCERNMSTMSRVVEAGSSWASSQAFRKRKDNSDMICFDEFAEWYTHVGYSNIPWLELLDLQKWLITDA